MYVVRKWPLRGRSRFACWNIKRVSLVTVQCAFRAKYSNDPSTDKTIHTWYKQFTETGCLWKQKSSGRTLSTEDDERIQASFLHSPKKSTITADKGAINVKNNSVEGSA